MLLKPFEMVFRPLRIRPLNRPAFKPQRKDFSGLARNDPSGCLRLLNRRQTQYEK